ncbi:MAG TPA: universal stress protein [Woeseiaceae bacterium]|nr:universal stress protein [Woeseiaceae bacterium]
MTNVKTVLAGVDPDDRDHLAIERAHQLAAASGARVYLLLSAYDQSLTGGVLSDRESLESARQDYLAKLGGWLEDRARPLREDGIAVKTEVSWHSPRYDLLLAKASELHADVIVRAARRHSTLDKLLFAASDWELVRRAPQPVWIVKKKADFRASGARVLAAVDPVHPGERQANLDRKLVAAATRIVKLFGGAAHVFHAWNPAATLSPVAGAGHHAAVPALTLGRELIEELREQRQQQLDKLVSEFDLPPENGHLVAGDVRSAVDELAGEVGIDVVVAGAVARGRLERLLIGSTAERLLDDVDCDVVVIKPDTFPRTL